MDNTVIIALISLLGTLAGSLSGIVISSKLTNYRIEQLEKKVDKHTNSVSEIPVIKEQIKVLTHRVDEIEKGGN
jgi:ABC-type lipoprotein release transport system permease subunit